MNIHERVECVKAMEFLARQVNDEEVFEGWLMCGVADGDGEMLNDEDVYSYYIQDDNFADLMETFLSVMKGAKQSGGLFCDKIVSKHKTWS